MKKIYFALMAFIAILMVTSCSKEEFETTPASAEPVEEAPAYLNPDYVNIDWSDAHVTSYDENAGEFVFTMSSDIPEIKSGSVLSIDADTAGCVCIVDQCFINGQEIMVKGRKGELYDVFGNTEMLLTTMDVPSEMATKASSGDIVVGVPTTVIYENEDGVAETLPYSVTKGLTKILTWEKKIEDEDLLKTKFVDIKLIEAKLYFDLGLYLDVNFKGWSLTPKSVTAWLEGNSEAKVEVGVEAAQKEKQEFKRTLKKNALPMRTIKFMVGYVPVFITLGGDIDAKLKLEAKQALRFSTSVENKFHIKTGFTWNEGSGIKPVYECKNTPSFNPPSFSLIGSAEAKAYVYPTFEMKLYSVLGPTFSIQPFFGVKGEFSSRSKGFSIEGKLGMELESGISVFSKKYETPTITVFEKTVFDKTIAL